MQAFHDPNTAVLVLAIGLLGILFEFHAPGSVLPGVIGAALVLLAAATLSRYPLSRGAVILIAIAVLMLLIEVKVSSHGVLAGCGALLLACGVYLLIDSPDPAEHIGIATSFAVVLPIAILTAFLLTIAAQARSTKLATGLHSLIGKTGTVADASRLRVFIGGEYWNARSASQLERGAVVRVDSVAHMELSVSALHDRMETS